MALMNDALPDKPGPQGWRDGTDLAHATNTGTEWGRQAASAVMWAFRTAPETSREKAQNIGAELLRLKSRLAEAHGHGVAEAWHQAALNAFRAGMPDPE